MPAAADSTKPFASPYGTGTRADIILVTTDGVQLYVHQQFVSMMSPVLSRTFSGADSLDLPLGDQLPKYTVPTNAATMVGFLRYCYPTGVVPVADDALDDIHSIHALALDLEAYKVIDLIKTLLQERVTRDAYRVFALSCLLLLPDIAKAAARQTLHHLFLYNHRDYASVAEFAVLPASNLIALSAYRAKCVQAITRCLGVHRSAEVGDPGDRERVDGLPWWSDAYGPHSDSCGTRLVSHPDPTAPECYKPTPWFSKLLDHAQASASVTPTTDAVAAALCDYTYIWGDVIQCEVCSKQAGSPLRALADSLCKDVEKQIDMVTREHVFLDYTRSKSTV
ncbi:hypothetical protein FB45DRAFT_869220 [Roridomyces roridus]|uniref:BTB domain-containing protein n=1 Tax=Roridomyces roridus TaxID=1738132 RepID=A0AAD7BNI8_9AGAR|nr:hypothetical protein FB45DRAFT_869220 [Roridomyces roridus]